MKQTRILLAGVSVLVPAAALQVPALAEARGTAEFHPPASDLILTRTVSRSLVDGQEIVARRRYTVRFVREKDGYTLYGELLEVTVDAPPMLATLAELERERPDLGMFPIKLDSMGRIRNQAGAALTSSEAGQKADSIARSMVDRASLDAEEKRQIQEQVPRILSASRTAGARLPPELFDPAAGPRRLQQVLTLPGGAQGQVDVAVNVSRISRLGLPQSVERTVTTVLEGSTRVSREVWTISGN